MTDSSILDTIEEAPARAKQQTALANIVAMSDDWHNANIDYAVAANAIKDLQDDGIKPTEWEWDHYRDMYENIEFYGRAVNRLIGDCDWQPIREQLLAVFPFAVILNDDWMDSGSYWRVEWEALSRKARSLCGERRCKLGLWETE